MTETDINLAIEKAEKQVKEVEDLAYELFVEHTLYNNNTELVQLSKNINNIKNSMTDENLRRQFATIDRPRFVLKAEIKLGIREKDERF